MDIRRDIAPTPWQNPRVAPKKNVVDEGGSRFKEALAKVEKHRKRVRAALALGLATRMLLEFDLLVLLVQTDDLITRVPFMGLQLLSYLIVLWFLAARTRDRFGFGMTLGIGVLHATYLIVGVVMAGAWEMDAIWRPLAVAAAHIPMAITGFMASTAYPPNDSKQPWVVGFITALAFLSLGWFATDLQQFLQ
jgi:FtsH-binding integral membrane protein